MMSSAAKAGVAAIASADTMSGHPRMMIFLIAAAPSVHALDEGDRRTIRRGPLVADRVIVERAAIRIGAAGHRRIEGASGLAFIVDRPRSLVFEAHRRNFAGEGVIGIVVGMRFHAAGADRPQRVA